VRVRRASNRGRESSAQVAFYKAKQGGEGTMPTEEEWGAINGGEAPRRR
jgi:hypothetical protein